MDIFHIGDRVESLVNHEYIFCGDTGTICCFAGGMIGVEWDKKFSIGHDCYGSCKNGHGWFVYQKNIEICNDENEIDEVSFSSIVFH